MEEILELRGEKNIRKDKNMFLIVLNKGKVNEEKTKKQREPATLSCYHALILAVLHVYLLFIFFFF